MEKFLFYKTRLPRINHILLVWQIQLVIHWITFCILYLCEIFWNKSNMHFKRTQTSKSLQLQRRLCMNMDVASSASESTKTSNWKLQQNFLIEGTAPSLHPTPTRRCTPYPQPHTLNTSILTSLVINKATGSKAVYIIGKRLCIIKIKTHKEKDKGKYISTTTLFILVKQTQHTRSLIFIQTVYKQTAHSHYFK